MAASLGSTWWQYLVLFLAVAASWAGGVPFVGTVGPGAAAVAASQEKLDLVALLERPDRHQVGREKMMEQGERLYTRWGWLAVFFTPAIVWSTAKCLRTDSPCGTCWTRSDGRCQWRPAPTCWAGSPPATTPGTISPSWPSGSAPGPSSPSSPRAAAASEQPSVSVPPRTE